jgi:lysozyme
MHVSERRITERVIVGIKAFEGFRGRAYRDPVGIWTIGWGNTHNVHDDDTISEHDADALLREQCAQIGHAIEQIVRVPLTQGQFDALVSFAFNCGLKRFVESTLLKELNAGHYDKAGDQLERWVWAGDKRLPGLVARRELEHEWWREGSGQRAA